MSTKYQQWARGLDDISRNITDLRKERSIVYFLYDVLFDYSLLVQSIQSEFGSHPDAEKVQIIKQPWVYSIMVQFWWPENVKIKAQHAIDNRIRDLAVAYDAVLDVKRNLSF